MYGYIFLPLLTLTCMLPPVSLAAETTPSARPASQHPSQRSLLLPTLQSPSAQVEASKEPVGEPMPWKLDVTMSIPFRGFELKTGEKGAQVQDELNTIDYSPSVSLEGSIFIAYNAWGFRYSGTLAAASLDDNTAAPSSENSEYRFSLLLDSHLFELSHQRLKGMQTDLETDNTHAPTRVARPDLTYTDFRLRWIGGLPVWGAVQPNTLANFYTTAARPIRGRFSADLLASAELNQQKISGSEPFVPPARQAAFGQASTLSKVKSNGAGVGVGGGFTVLMHGKSFFSVAALVGGNYNISEARYADRSDDVSGFGAYANARMAVKFIFGHRDNHEIAFRLLHDSWMIPADESQVTSTASAMALNYGIQF